jgi:hypothetical protein
MGGVVAFTYGMGLFCWTYLVPVFIQTALSFPPSEAGAVLLLAGLVLALTIPRCARGVRCADRPGPTGLAGRDPYMCANYVPVTDLERMKLFFTVMRGDPVPEETWPGCAAPFVRQPREQTEGMVASC